MFVRFFLLFILLSIMQAATINAQVRGNDVLIMRDKSRIEVIITEVSDVSVSYKKKSDPDGPLFVVKKSDLEAIEYGNGEKESFPAPVTETYFTPEAAEKPVVYKSPAPIPRNKFEALMYSWSPDELRAARLHFKQKSKSAFTGGIVFTSLGVIAMGVGTVLMGESTSTTSSGVSVIVDDNKFNTGAVMLVGGLLGGATLGTIGFVRGGKNAAKASKLTRELLRRNEPLRSTSLRFSPGYNPVNKYGFLAVNLTF